MAKGDCLNSNEEPPDPRERTKQLIYLRENLERLIAMSGNSRLKSGMIKNVFPLFPHPSARKKEAPEFDTCTASAPLENGSQLRQYNATRTELYILLRKSLMRENPAELKSYTNNQMSADFSKAFLLAYPSFL